ncbi:MAG: nucleotidyltransferase domain-containing protein [Anaerolinea sp.]|nr:nucleotidyltransferase domain-containing protein [Anaerolinea sp.]
MITPTGFLIPEDKIAEFCEKHRIRKLALFGSVLRDDFDEDSDIDVLVEFEPDVNLGLDFFTIQFELEDMLGRRIDFATPEMLKRYVRRRILDSAQVVYERAG